MIKYNLFVIKAEFSASLLQSSVSHDPSEIILTCWFAAEETFLIIISVEIRCAASHFYKTVAHFQMLLFLENSYNHWFQLSLSRIVCSSIPPSNHKWCDFKEARMFSPPLTQELCDDVFNRASRLAQVWALGISDGSLWTHPPFLFYQILGLLHAYLFYVRSVVVSQFLLYYSTPLYHCAILQ